MTHDKVSISIVMATHDSMRYVDEQLDSLRAQTLSPDEVIIADNFSTDGTYEHVQEYISRYGLTNWSVYQNDHDIGIVQNFRNLLTKCSGEYIFTCDHDDVWMPDKLSEMVSVMKARPEFMLYDALLWKCAILLDSLYLLNRQLIYYRRHEHVSTGAYLAPKRRRNIREKKNVFSTSLFVLRNMKYYPTLRNALSDIYAVLFLK